VHGCNDLVGGASADLQVREDVRGLLRPDKLVAYLPDFDALARAADRLRTGLSGCPARVCPSPPHRAERVVVVGHDPPSETDQPSTLTGKAGGNGSPPNWHVPSGGQGIGASQLGCEPWEYAITRLQLLGVDTSTWAPKQTIWRPT